MRQDDDQLNVSAGGEERPKTDAVEKVTTPSPESNSETGFDVSELRLSQNFAEKIGVKKVLTTVPVRKPDRQWFVRTHPDESWHLHTAILDLRDDRETYIVHPELLPELTTEVSPKILVAAINRQGIVFLWPITLPDESGRHNQWHRSAQEAADLAGKSWVRVGANMSLGAYEVWQAAADYPEPEWPEEGFDSLIRIAFQDRIITTLNHPVLRRLRGEL